MPRDQKPKHKTEAILKQIQLKTLKMATVLRLRRPRKLIHFKCILEIAILK